MVTSFEPDRLARLIEAEGRALALLDAIEAAGLVRPGRTEGEVDADIAALAAAEFGIERHWHKRLVRAGANTLCVFSDTPPERTIEPQDMVYLDLGPVFGEWEADVGRTFALGGDPARNRLVAVLPEVFGEVRAHALATQGVTGAELYSFACNAAEKRGYIFGGLIAGHTIGEFPHQRWPVEKDHQRISAANPTRISDKDHLGRVRYWIIEIHLVAKDRSFGGFYERLMRP